MSLPQNISSTLELLSSNNYVADRSLATAVYLSLNLSRPLLLEGEAGVGKTEVAKVLAAAMGRKFIRLQCYEGLDVSSAVYEWDYSRQMIEIRLAEAEGITNRNAIAKDIYSEKFLIARPLLQALTATEQGAPVLLIDEIDRADEPFEAYLLEILSEFQITIPEFGAVKASNPPIVIVTSNRTREIHDALKRRCFYHWVDYPDVERELAILAVKAPRAKGQLAQQIVSFVQRLRDQDLYKVPGVAETIDWAHALVQIDVIDLRPSVVDDTLGVLLKYQDDVERIRGHEASKILSSIQVAAGV